MLLAAVAYAEDSATLLNEALAHYQNREDTAELQKAIDTLKLALQADPHNYEAAWRLSKAYWFQGNFSSGEKKPSFENGIKAGEKAIDLNYNNCEGHFWLGTNYALLAEASGGFTALGLIDNVKREINQAMSINEKCECGGPSRVLGKLYSKLPWFKGGSKKKAISYLTQSLDLCPHDTQSRIFLAEIYEAQGQKKDAMKLLREVEAVEPPAEWIPESKANKIAAEKMLRDLQDLNGKD
jgi:tetratricopeptide (TPR) repeat protein